VAAAADSNQQHLFAAEVHRRHDVGHVGATRNQSRMPVDHAVVHLARRFVTRVAWLDQAAKQAGSEA
jgi:hypothetical protein